MKAPLLLAFDGGGSKTECLLARSLRRESSPRVLGRGTGSGSSLLHGGVDQIRAVLRHCVQEAFAAAALPVNLGQVSAVCAGFASAGQPSTQAQFAAILSELFPNARCQVLMDLEIAWQGAGGGAPGVVLVGGTGSAAFGRSADGQTVRCGGWGPEISDEGSGTWIGREAVRLMFLARDGRRPATALRQHVLRQLQCANEDQVLELIRTGKRPRWSELLPAVSAAAQERDRQAEQLLLRAGKELAWLAHGALNQLRLTAPAVWFTGGVLTNVALVRQGLVEELMRLQPSAQVLPAAHKPVEGALVLASQAFERSAVRLL